MPIATVPPPDAGSLPAPEIGRRRRRGVSSVVLVLVVVALAVVVIPMGGGRSEAAVTPDVVRSAGWIASQIGPDGSVLSPTSGLPSVNYTMYALLGLASTGLHADAQDRALGYVARHVDDWVVSASAFDGPIGLDLPGRLGYLLLAVDARGADPTSFGVPATNLVARLQALYGSVEPGVYGTQNDWSAVTDQSLAILGLVAAGAPVPPGAVDWLVAQQCTSGPNVTAYGGWQARRLPSGGGIADCGAPDPLLYSGADTNSTGFAVQALAAVGRTGPIAGAITFLHAAQGTNGGFPWFTGGDPDPNSTGLVTQAVVAAGESPTGAAWTVSGVTPLDFLRSVTYQAGPDAGAMWFPTDPSKTPDLMATYQGLWGEDEDPFPFPPDPVPDPIVPETGPRFTG